MIRALACMVGIHRFSRSHCYPGVDGATKSRCEDCGARLIHDPQSNSWTVVR